jgi:hypothetical protein
MRRFLKTALLLTLPAALPGAAADSAEPDLTAGLLVYRVTEAGAAPYLSRILVTPSYVRMDYGAGGQGFVLFDRDSQVIYSADPSERTVLVIDPVREKPEAPMALAVSEQRFVDEEAPAIGGVTPVRYELKTNGQVCRHLIVLPGVMDAAVEGLREYFDALSYQQAATLANMPEDLYDPCDLSTHVFNPERGLAFGLPVQDWNADERRELLDFRPDFAVSPELFEIPAGYGRMSMPRASM